MGEWFYVQWKIAKKQRHKLSLVGTSGRTCALCGLQIAPRDFSLDHIISQDGIFEWQLNVTLLFDPGNLQGTHKLCNNRKGHQRTARS
jgi:hypothetical protein